MAIEEVKMTYFASIQKLILSGEEEFVKKLAAQYKEFILANQRRQGTNIDKSLKSRRH